MAKANYAFTNFGSDTAKAYGSNLDISIKTSVNVCNLLRGMTATKAITKLQNVIDFKEAIPFTRFNDGVGHRKGNMASGRFPQKASKAILALLNSAIANAAAKGLAEDLKIIHLCAHKAATPLHQGRQRRRAMKKTHIELVLKEMEVKQILKKQAPKSKSKPAPFIPKESATKIVDSPKSKVSNEEVEKITPEDKK
jgi:large subunit ribosomal protein L22